MRRLIFTGIGSRETPARELRILTAMSWRLAEMGFTGRSGAAPGADTAVENGIDLARGRKEIYLPWPLFNGNRSGLFYGCKESERIASEIHPAWNRLSAAGKKLHARNVYQVLGMSLSTPSLFVLCYTRDGASTETECTKDTGGTASAIWLASRYGVPVYNIGRPGVVERMEQFLLDIRDL